MAQTLTDIAAGVENLGKLEGACQWTEQSCGPTVEGSAEKQASLSVELVSAHGVVTIWTVV